MIHRLIKTAAIAVPSILLTLSSAYAASIDNQTSCENLTNVTIANGKITEATYIASGKSELDPFRMFTGAPNIEFNLPAHCMIRGEIERRTRADGKENALRFEVRLPDDWKQRFIFQGGGGTDGFLANAIGTTPISGSNAAPALTRGYAVTSMNGGHDGVDPTFALDQQARLDYAYAAIGKVTQAAKALVTTYYQARPKFSYFMGCSNGGREGMIAAQRYPLEFDGVISANPGFNLSYAGLAEIWDTQAFYSIAPEDKNGKKILANALTHKDLDILSKAILEQCDAKDGLVDGIVADYNSCDFDPSTTICKADNNQSCLSDDKIAVIKRVFNGAHDSQGNKIYNSWPYDAGVNADGWRAWKLGTSQEADKPNALNVVLGGSSVNFYFITPPQPGFDNSKFNFDDDVALVKEMSGINNATATFMNTFVSQGSKLMIIQGVSDPVFSADDVEQWYKKTTTNTSNGDLNAMRDWARLFMVPGMTHCGGGPALDNLDPLTEMEKWVEQGKTPAFIPATGQSFPGKSMPICAYPQIARYNGKGDTKVISSYTCQ